jgi:hypothetical protein
MWCVLDAYFRNVIVGSAATKQFSFSLSGKPDCFAWLAMTVFDAIFLIVIGRYEVAAP